MTKAIVDTDILSAFGKAEKSDMLGFLFEEVFIAPAVFEELLQAQRTGFSFVEDTFKLVKLKQLIEAIEREDRTTIKAKDRILRE